MADETREITVEVDAAQKQWLEVAARDHQQPIDETAQELLNYGLVHHEQAMSD